MISKSRNILVTSYYFYPENTPRAFRTYELVKEFSKRGYKVHIFAPEIAELPLELKDFCVINKVKSLKNNPYLYSTNRTESPIKKAGKFFSAMIRKVLRYFICDISGFVYGIQLAKKLNLECKEMEFDWIISIGLPFYVHMGTAFFIKKNKKSGLRICDYGDPFYKGSGVERFPGLKILEKWVTDKFQYISVPTELAKPSYERLNRNDDIVILPQGLDLKRFNLPEYIKNDIPTFCYAGLFYERIRNPKIFFDYLRTVEQEFQFIIYTNLKDTFSREICMSYKQYLGDKLIIKDIIPRDEVVAVIAKMDFVVNVDNTTNQVPSKLIDYAISKRPIISFNEETFDAQVFSEFLQGNYQNRHPIDINRFDIVRIVDCIEALEKPVNRCETQCKVHIK